MNRDTFYITTSIAYTNAPPHVGYAYELIIADILARYARNRGKKTFFLTGTDEHGIKIFHAAQKKGVEPQEFVDEISGHFKNLAEKLLISNDEFIRTSDKKQHWPATEEFWQTLIKSGDIYKDVYEGLYCEGCEKFLQESELVDGKCPIHDKVPERIEEDNYFFKLSRYAGQVYDLLAHDKIKIVPASRKAEVLALIKEGSKDVSFSRLREAVGWGIPVPGDPSQSIYVWADALVNYLSALGYGSKDDGKFKTFWPPDVHVIGKDILRFHALLWPAMLLSAKLPLPEEILVHGYITMDGAKMSKSVGNVLDPLVLIEKYGAEAVRYFFSREVSPFEDGDFSEARFVESYNANLANGIGNLVSRTAAMAERYFAGKVSRKLPQDVPPLREMETFSTMQKVESPSLTYLLKETYIPEYDRSMERFEIHNAAHVAWKLIQELDGYISDYEPYKLFKENPDKTENILWNLCLGIMHVAELVDPYLPETAEHIRRLLGIKKGRGALATPPEIFMLQPLEKPLFPRIETK